MNERTDPPAPRRPWWALALALTAVVVAVAVVAPRLDDAGADSPMVAVAPGGSISLDEVPADHARLYRAAAEHDEVFEQVACYCGCESFLDHRHLLDCFVRPGGGWERHATGCTVCLAEAEDVLEDLDAGLPADEIAERIDRRYGVMTDPDRV